MDDPRLILIAALSALAALASLAGLFSLIRRRRARARAGGSGERESLPYRMVEALLAPSERALYAALRPAAVAQGADVFAKVHLADVLQVRKGAADYEALRTRIEACCVDFLLCERERLVPLLAVSMENGHGQGSRGGGDFLEGALADVGLPLVHIPAKRSYDPDEIAALVRDRIASAAPAPAPSDEEDLASQPASARVPNGWQEPASTSAWLSTEPGPPGEAQAAGETSEDAAETAALAAEAPLPALTPDDSVEATGDATEDTVPAGELDDDVAPADEEPADVAEPGDEADVPATAEEPSAPEETDDEPRCPACGQKLVEMKDLETGVVVLACSRYPECPHVQAR